MVMLTLACAHAARSPTLALRPVLSGSAATVRVEQRRTRMPPRRFSEERAPAPKAKVKLAGPLAKPASPSGRTGFHLDRSPSGRLAKQLSVADVDEDEDGIDFSTFASLVRSIEPNAESTTEAELRARFEEMDVDADGRLTKSEYTRATFGALPARCTYFPLL